MDQNSRVVGKHTLESLTVGMYADNRIIFREYIQNASDAIDAAISRRVITQGEGVIDVVINSEHKEIRIRDNGTGIPKDKVFNALGDIGRSNKTVNEDRGFRGIGRLGGLGYCSELRFETSYKGEPFKTVMSWDATRLRELLQPSNIEFESVTQVIDAVTHLEFCQEKVELHYFEVILSGISNGHENLLDTTDIRNYLSQVAPVPFNYSLGLELQKINERLKQCGIASEEYTIFLHDHSGDTEQIYKPYRRSVPAGDRDNSFIKDIKFFEGHRSDDSLFFLGWYAVTDLPGMVKDDSVNGIRVRKRNILIGDNRSLDEFFGTNKTYQNFNRWFIGEIYVFDDDLIPNARRDDFEKNSTYFRFKREVEKTTHQLARLPHPYSKLRSTEKKLKEIPQSIRKIEEELESAGITETRREQLSEQVETLKKQAKQIDPAVYSKIKTPIEADQTLPKLPSQTFRSSQVSASMFQDSSNSSQAQEAEQEKSKLLTKLEELDDKVQTSTDFATQRLPSSIPRQCRKQIDIIFNVIDRVLDDGLAQELRQEIVKALQIPRKENR
ncbi:MAG: ATP-binding protein [Caldilineaceae bacterium]|nr:ATP-binding protein [Caldilineaceae bacterium]